MADLLCSCNARIMHNDRKHARTKMNALANKATKVADKRNRTQLLSSARLFRFLR